MAGRVRRAERRRGRARGPVRDQRRRLAQPPEAARHPGHGHLRRAVVPLGPLAGGPRHHRDTVRPDRRRRQRVPDRADHRRRGRAADHLPAHGAVDHPQPAVPRAPCRRGRVGAAPPAVLRPVVPVHHDLRRHRGRDRSRTGSTPSTTTRRHQSINAVNAKRADGAAGLDALHRRRPSRPDREVHAGLPGHRASASCRTTASWLRCLQQPNVELVRTGIERSRPRRRRHRRTAPTTRPTSSATRPASGTTSSWPPWR